MNRLAFLTLLLLGIPLVTLGNATTMRVRVIEVSPANEGYQVTLVPEETGDSKEPLTIHLRFHPKRAAGGASQKREDFEKALGVLKNATAGKQPILVGLMSGTGFNPIEGRPGHYLSELIQVVDWFGKEGTVCFFHSDQYVEAPE